MVPRLFSTMRGNYPLIRLCVLWITCSVCIFEVISVTREPITYDVTERGNNKTNVLIAVIVPFNAIRLFSTNRSFPALDIALQKVIDLQLLPDHKLVVNYADSKCSSVAAPIEAFNFFMKRMVHVFVGPVCDYSLAPVARYSPFWNIPVVSPGGLAHDFGADKSNPNAEFPLLTRVGTTLNSLAHYLHGSLTHFRFKRIKVVYNSFAFHHVVDRFCYLAMSALIDLLKKSNIVYHLYPLNKEKLSLDNMLKEEVGNRFSGELCDVYSVQESFS